MKNQSWLHAYILHRRPYRETSYLVNLFSREAGRITVVAKGVRNSKSDRKSLLQPFNPVRLQCSGKSELKNLNQLESDGRLLSLTGNSLFCGMYVNELTNRVMPEGLESESLFNAYIVALDALESQALPVEQILRKYEFAVLDELGQTPDLTVQSDTGDAIEEGRYYLFVPESGLIPAPQTHSAQALHGEHLLALAGGNYTAEVMKTAKKLSRQALAPLLGGKPLKSRDLFIRTSR